MVCPHFSNGERMSEEWITVCSADDLVEGSGVCALLSQPGKDEPVALFKVSGAGIFALSNYDPLGEAWVLSRGIIGSVGDKLVVASPLYKQHYCLDSGVCLEDQTVSVPTWPVRVESGQVQIKSA